jgi:hypothetical protein
VRRMPLGSCSHRPRCPAGGASPHLDGLLPSSQPAPLSSPPAISVSRSPQLPRRRGRCAERVHRASRAGHSSRPAPTALPVRVGDSDAGPSGALYRRPCTAGLVYRPEAARGRLRAPVAEAEAVVGPPGQMSSPAAPLAQAGCPPTSPRVARSGSRRVEGKPGRRGGRGALRGTRDEGPSGTSEALPSRSEHATPPQKMRPRDPKDATSARP